jgi:GNAT superfamily N-acetyltransferase
MVSTVLNDRGQGIGRWITASAIDFFIARGCNEFVLHATPLGYSVYQKLGFEHCCDYGIFWMLGKK